jgi:hypothetical protein
MPSGKPIKFFGNLKVYNQSQNFKDFQEFNKWLGLPEKLGKPMPLFDYQLAWHDDILRNKHVIINKFVGAGATEIIPRIMLEMILTKEDLATKQFGIITGTRQKFTIDIIKNRILPIITKNHPEVIASHVNEQIMFTNGRYIRGFPTENLSALHGQHDLAFIFVDEAAFFHPNEQERLMIALERNDSKSQPHIVLVSTPNGPQGSFYETYMDALQSRNDYKAITTNYLVGRGRIWDELDWEGIMFKKEHSPRLFAQEFNNEFIAPMGALTEEPYTDTVGVIDLDNLNSEKDYQ